MVARLWWPRVCYTKWAGAPSVFCGVDGRAKTLTHFLVAERDEHLPACGDKPDLRRTLMLEMAVVVNERNVHT